MNRYASIEKTFFARNVYQGALAAVLPADLVIAAADWKPQLFVNKYSVIDPISINSNVFIKQAGIYCNFADGLVFKSFKDVIDIKVFGFIANPRILPAPVTGNFVGSPASKTVTGTNFNLLSPGSIIKVGDYFYCIDTIAGGGLSSVLTDFPKITQGAGSTFEEWVALSPFFTFNLTDLRNLNCMYPVERFISPSNVVAPASLAATSKLLLLVSGINALTGMDSHSVTFLTNTIDSTFASADVSFDVGLTIEYTV